MDVWAALMNGFAVALTLQNLMWCLVGCMLGTAVGVLPGVGPAVTVALLLPITTKVDASGALIMFAGIFAYGLAIVRAGFIVSSIVLFMLVARGFGSRRWLLNAFSGVLLAVAVYSIFTYGLGLMLPPGVLKGIF